MPDSFEDRYRDVLYAIESAIVTFYRETPEIADSNVDRVLEGLVRAYGAEANNRSRPSLRLNEEDQALFDNIQQACETRLGHAEEKQTNEVDQNRLVKTPVEIVACLKRIRLSVRRWGTRGGRKGYLNYVSQFIK